MVHTFAWSPHHKRRLGSTMFDHLSSGLSCNCGGRSLFVDLTLEVLPAVALASSFDTILHDFLKDTMCMVATKDTSDWWSSLLPLPTFSVLIFLFGTPLTTPMAVCGLHHEYEISSYKPHWAVVETQLTFLWCDATSGLQWGLEVNRLRLQVHLHLVLHSSQVRFFYITQYVVLSFAFCLLWGTRCLIFLKGLCIFVDIIQDLNLSDHHSASQCTWLTVVSEVNHVHHYILHYLSPSQSPLTVLLWGGAHCYHPQSCQWALTLSVLDWDIHDCLIFPLSTH